MQDEIFLKKHEDFERKVMNMLLAGEQELFVRLRKQYEVAIVKGRDFDGYGFYTDFEVPDEALRVKCEINYENAPIGDVLIDYNGQEGAYGIILFINNGVIDCLEGFPYISHEWIDDYDKIDDIYHMRKTLQNKLHRRDAGHIKDILMEILPVGYQDDLIVLDKMKESQVETAEGKIDR